MKARLATSALVLIALTGTLVVDHWLYPYCPVLLLLAVGMFGTAAWELATLIPEPSRPSRWEMALTVTILLSTVWATRAFGASAPNSWQIILAIYLAVLVGHFFWCMAFFKGPGHHVVHLALLGWGGAYLGLLPAALAHLRWLGGPEQSAPGLKALLLTIAVTKVGDVGAYFVGRYSGRNQMAPLLSPRKTWEGFAGGLALAVVTAVCLNELLAPRGTTLPGPLPGPWMAALFGVTVGLAGVLGDLAESLIKRDQGSKDASTLLPGFGGMLDLVDALLLAGPVAYIWFVGIEMMAPRIPGP